MATGILSVAAQAHGFQLVSVTLAILAATAFVILAIELLTRLGTEPSSLWEQLKDLDFSLRSFSFVAATCVLAARLDRPAAAVSVLGALALAGWAVLAATTVRALRSAARSGLCGRVHGGWLLPSVATTGLAITATDLVRATVRPGLMIVCAAVLWFLGIAVYLAVTSLIITRMVRAPLRPESVTPDTWILMGALAIGALAGDHLHTACRVIGWSGWGSQCIEPITMVLWIGASLWLPALVWAEVWRAEHRTQRAHLGQWWAGIFPLGMYAVATQATSNAFHLHTLTGFSFVVFSDALTAWILLVTMLLYRQTRG